MCYKVQDSWYWDHSFKYKNLQAYYLGSGNCITVYYVSSINKFTAGHLETGHMNAGA